MDHTSTYSNARDYITDRAAIGRYTFTSTQAQSALGTSPAATKLALNRLSKQRLIASPSRGFYVVLPPEYQALGCLPADQFIPALMEHLGQSYYAGLLSAAQYYGAAHHRPQEFQVMIEKMHRPIQCGSVSVIFITRKHLTGIPVQSLNTPRGTILVSSPEATAVDIVGYHYHVGGIDQAATILMELSEKIDPEKLVLAAQTAPIVWAQRLGYLLELVGAGEKTLALKTYVHQHTRLASPLLSKKEYRQSPRNKTWKLYINAEVEVDL
ncbi:MAG: type IV toxin-antitoxin system AbiEi family antitoxin [Oligoflexales bacterium]